MGGPVAKRKNPKPSKRLLATIEAHRADGVPMVRVDALRPHPNNPRDHSDVSMLVDVINAAGWTRPIVYRAADMMIGAGHGAWIAARALGLTEIPAVQCAADLSDDDFARLVVVADNRATEVTPWNPLDLLELARGWTEEQRSEVGLGSDAPDFAILFGDDFDAEGAGEMSGAAARGKRGRKTRDLDASDYAVPDVPITQPGDAWELGDHRLLCGDALARSTLARFLIWIGGRAGLVCTDPPYAIYGSSTGIAPGIADDRMVVPFFEGVGRLSSALLEPFAHAYVFHDWRSASALRDGFRTIDLELKNVLVWDKGGGLGNMYAQCYESIAFYAKRPRKTAMSNGDVRGHRTVLAHNVVRGISRVPGKDREGHNAAKPVALIRMLIENSTKAGETVVDPFGGTGTTLIAAQECGRRAVLSELSPKWCDVIVRRWERLTGGKARRIEASQLAPLEVTEGGDDAEDPSPRA
jgi:DNA modification methylase